MGAAVIYPGGIVHQDVPRGIFWGAHNLPGIICVNMSPEMRYLVSIHQKHSGGMPPDPPTKTAELRSIIY